MPRLPLAHKGENGARGSNVRETFASWLHSAPVLTEVVPTYETSAQQSPFLSESAAVQYIGLLLSYTPPFCPVEHLRLATAAWFLYILQ